ncbi:EAL domain-containing protein [Glycocaulis sp.]|uniref:EAL domain-containing protein n=1 Tax=Glycocaulis sp. TaxID=1969725 RepID=UPI003D1BE0BC
MSAGGEGMLSKAAEAAGALAIQLDLASGKASISGAAEAFGLTCDGVGDFLDCVAPSDRKTLAGQAEGQVDLRLRLAPPGEAVRYVRLLGVRQGDGVTALLLPAGTGPGTTLSTLDAEAALTAGLESKEIIAHFQPIIALDGEYLAGFEALARWHRPGLGVMGPDDFLFLADRLGLMGQVGDQVRGSAADNLARWFAGAQAAPDVYVSANASVGELLSDGFVDTLTGALEQAKVPRGRYRLEITETEIMRDPDQAAEILHAVKASGVKLVLDDFGTGYSSLSRLDRFPFDVIKIDQYFVRSMIADASARAITASVVKLARNLGMTIIAEGVETAEMADLVAEMGCDFAQGFHYAGALDPQAAGLAVSQGVAGRFAAPRPIRRSGVA